MRLKFAFIAAALLLPAVSFAQDAAGTFGAGALEERSSRSNYAELIIDTTSTVKTYKDINDYSMLGINYGYTMSSMMFNPTEKQGWHVSPGYVSLMYTKYLKMFGYMPYFGYQIGVAYGHEGFKFNRNKKTGSITLIDGAEEMDMEVIELPFMAQIHADATHFKVMANAGIYGGYRLSIHRIGDQVPAKYVDNWMPSDKRYEFGLQGGVSFGLIFSPVEFHFGAVVRYSWSSIYAPDSSPSRYNQYFYRFAYPFDINIVGGIHFQLTKRTGKTTKDLKRQAREIVESGWDVTKNE